MFPWTLREANHYFSTEAAYFFDDFCVFRNGEFVQIRPGNSGEANFYIKSWEDRAKKKRGENTLSCLDEDAVYNSQSPCEQQKFSVLERFFSGENEGKSSDLAGCYHPQKNDDEYAQEFIEYFGKLVSGSVVAVRAKTAGGLTGREPNTSRPWYNPQYGILRSDTQPLNAKPISFLKDKSCIRILRTVRGTGSTTLKPAFPYNIILIGKPISCG